MDIANSLIAEFEHMVRRDGGSISLLGVHENEIRLGYRMGANPSCASGTCILPHMELQEMMNETLSRRAPAMRAIVQLIS
jgi:Fe-S cluster biogenesis protein NfuA